MALKASVPARRAMSAGVNETDGEWVNGRRSWLLGGANAYRGDL